MPNVVRLSFSIEGPLLRQLEKIVKSERYANRSEFIRDLIREKLVEREWNRNEKAVGTITLVYNHHTRGLSDRLIKIQHGHRTVILTSTHIHLDNHLCAETILVKGKGKQIENLANMLKQQKGVLHTTLSISSTGKHLA